MTTSGQADDHRRALKDLVDLALHDLVAFWDSLSGLSPAQRATETRRYLPVLVNAYSAAAGALAADFYDELRSSAQTAARYMASPADAPTAGETDSLLAWALQALFPKEADADPAVALSRLTSGTQRLVANVDRLTVITNTRSDPDAVRYARHARANACAFCALIATRQADYLTEESAIRVTGEIDPRNPTGFPIRGPRGSQALGEKYHTDCYCIAVPVWPGQELEEAPYVQQWRDAYHEAAKPGSTIKAVLARMRENTDLH